RAQITERRAPPNGCASRDHALGAEQREREMIPASPHDPAERAVHASLGVVVGPEASAVRALRATAASASSDARRTAPRVRARMELPPPAERAIHPLVARQYGRRTPAFDAERRHESVPRSKLRAYASSAPKAMPLRRSQAFASTRARS